MNNEQLAAKISKIDPRDLKINRLKTLPLLAVEVRRVSDRSYQICIWGEPRYQGRTFLRGGVEERLSFLRRSYTVTVKQSDAREKK